ncbi:MAG: redoxin domain-containing protein [Desulfobacterales bacterium]|nr:redoxin domain-containing protein [Desulfobacterales bacterium]
MLQELESEKIMVIAASVDLRENAREIIEKLTLTYPIAYGLNAEEISGMTGAYYHEEKKFLQPTNFLVRPDKTIEVASYSSGPIGRFVAKDVVRLVQFYKGKR